MPEKLRYSKFADRIDIDALEAEIGFDPLYTQGDNDVGHCPDWWGLHANGDTTGKFAIEREKRVYNCWVCGGGSLLDLAMAHTGLDPDEATKWLYKLATDEDTSDSNFLTKFSERLSPHEEEKVPLPFFNPNVLSRFDNHHEWFDSRWIDDKTRKAFRAGYNAESTRRSKKGELYTGPSIIFPHFWDGRLVGWQQRWIDDDRPKWVPKYTNTPDFPKDKTIFNINDVLAHTWGHEDAQPVIVVESVPTVMYLRAQGYPAVGTFGANVTENQMRILRRLQSGVLLAPDFDAAGAEWLENLGSYLDRYIPVSEVPPVTVKDGADLGDLRPERLANHLERARSSLLTSLFDR